MLEVLKYPDPVLRRGGQKVERFDSELKKTAQEMLDTMYKYQGVGLAAPQVGIRQNLLVLNSEGDLAKRDLELILVNPEILDRKKLEYGEEGCLSFPGLFAEVERHQKIRIRYQDLEGAEHEAGLEGFLARVVLHEIDHLQGVLFVDRLSAAERIRVRFRLAELEQRYEAKA